MADTEGPRRLYRSRRDRVFAGVCGGTAEYFDIDPVVARLLWIFSVFAFGTGVLLYLIAMIIIPNHPNEVPQSPEAKKSTVARRNSWNFAIGAVLVLLGGLLLLDQLDMFDNGWFRFNFFPWRLFWPLAFIGLGIYFVASGTTVKDTTNGVKSWVNKNRIFKSRDEKIAFGVCGGLAKHLDVDPTIVRLVTVAAFFLSAGFVFFLYIIAAIIIPYEEEISAAQENGAENGS